MRWISIDRIIQWTAAGCLLGITLIFSSGCSSFNHDYQLAMLKGVPKNSIEGPWIGSWQSAKDGHHGQLRGVITRLDGNVYRTQFKATFKRLFTFSYTSEVDFEMQPHDTGYEFSGTKKLGWLAGGKYTYEGRVTPERFFSTYQNKWDKGTFVMQRPKAP